MLDEQLAAEKPIVPPGWTVVTVQECFCKEPPYHDDGGHVHLPDYTQIRDGPGSGCRTVAVPPYMIRHGHVSERAIRRFFRKPRWRGSYQQKVWGRRGCLDRFRLQARAALGVQ